MKAFLSFKKNFYERNGAIMLENLERIKAKFQEELNIVSSNDELERIRVSFLGKKGIVTEELKNLKNLGPDEKKRAGMEVNNLKNEIEKAIVDYQKALEEKEYQREIDRTIPYDYSIPSDMVIGTLHPITIVQKQIEDIFN